MQDLGAKLAQLFVVSLSAPVLTGAERTILTDASFGGFILFEHNCSDTDQITRLCGSLWSHAHGAPPFIAIDHEGGRVHRLPQPFTHFPTAAQIGETCDPAIVYRIGRASATELRLAGINLNFAPVLDVNSNPKNPVIGDRSFGSDPRKVTELGAAWIRGTRDAGIIPCGKHFAGHGDTARDSHLELPRVERDIESLRQIELPPFAHACRSGIESLMTAHVVYSAFDDEFPATLSRRIITGLLREELRYDGVVFSDALEMKAISDNFGEEEAAALALQAGVDVLLYGHPLERVVPVYEFLCRRAENDAALRNRIEQSHARVTALKRRYLERFTGEPGDAVDRTLAKLDHGSIVREIQASL
ncbi:MAG TPA: beta-N-acetylhexosaminidase [Candidatus Binatia bacterium]